MKKEVAKGIDQNKRLTRSMTRKAKDNEEKKVADKKSIQ